MYVQPKSIDMPLACSRQANNWVQVQTVPIRIASTRPTILIIAVRAGATSLLLEELGTSHRC